MEDNKLFVKGMVYEIFPERTAIHRRALSKPIQRALKDGVIKPSDRVLDYGCGHGGDVKRLIERGIETVGYDPFVTGRNFSLGYCHSWIREGTYDVVNLGYVINIIPEIEDVKNVLAEVYHRAGRVVIIAARVEEPTYKDAVEVLDGYVTNRGTFQRFFKKDDHMETFLFNTLPVQDFNILQRATKGVFYVWKGQKK